MSVAEGLNPTQRSTLAALGAGDLDARAAFDPNLATELRARLDAGLADAVTGVPGDRPLTVTKHLLDGMHGCQARFLHEKSQPFEPSVPVVRGTIAHKALELAVHWPTKPVPLDLVDAAIGRVKDTDHWASDFLEAAEDDVLAELRGSVAEIVHKFLETWPPLTPTMRPATEARMWAEICAGRIVLKGQADLTLGQPIGSGTTARKIVVDYKTGARLTEHRSDLRFYALIETLRLGVPPRLTVTSYLASGTLEIETITEEILFSAAARTIDGVQAYVECTQDQVEPIRRPSAACRWCALLDDCDVGQDYLDEFDG